MCCHENLLHEAWFVSLPDVSPLSEGKNAQATVRVVHVEECMSPALSQCMDIKK